MDPTPTTADRSPAGRGAKRGILKSRLLALHDTSTSTRARTWGIRPCFDYRLLADGTGSYT